MKESDAPRFRECLEALSGYYNRELSQGIADIYWLGLQRFDLAAVQAAIGRHVKNPDAGQFMPKVADIVRMLEGTSIDVAMVAWAKVDKAVREVGTYASVAFDDPLIHRVVHDMGGWVGLGSKSLDEWPFIGNEFRTRYTAFRSRQETPEYPTHLVGITEADNARKGYAVGEVVLVGNAEAAKRVMEGGTDKPAIGFQRVGKPASLAVAASNVRQLPNRAKALEVVGEAQ